LGFQAENIWTIFASSWVYVLVQAFKTFYKSSVVKNNKNAKNYDKHVKYNYLGEWVTMCPCGTVTPAGCLLPKITR
jgi:hypothetical protein